MDPVVLAKRKAIAAALDRDIVANVSENADHDGPGRSDAETSRPSSGSGWNASGGAINIEHGRQ
jgi:hypothetical protein